jgi:hypothetical protein
MLGTGSGRDQSAEKRRVGGGAKPRISLLAAENERFGMDCPPGHLLEAANRRRTRIPSLRELLLHGEAASEPILPRPNLDHYLAAVRERYPQDAREVPALEDDLGQTAS